MMAAFFKAPLLMIDKEESKKLAEGIANVQRHYDVRITQKQIDWSNLIVVLCMIYGSRFVAAMNARKPTINQGPQKTKTIHDPSLPGGQAEVVVP